MAHGLSVNRYFDREGFAFEDIPSATFSLHNPLKIVKGCRQIFSGVQKSRKILRNFAPDVVIGFGSFFTLPVLIAALIEKIPIILHEQNAIPGKVNRLFASFAHTTAITFPNTRTYFKKIARGRAVEVLFPLRQRGDEKNTLEQALKYFGLGASEKPTLLIFGGSQGAAPLNSLFLGALPYLPPIRVLHFTGREERVEEARKCYEVRGIESCVKAFEPRMDLAMLVADCAVTRAGAATISELIEYELPALLIPYPFATENHQEKNGMHFVSIVKGGKMYKEKELDSAHLAAALCQELEALETTKKNIANYKLQRQALSLPRLIEEIFI